MEKRFFINKQDILNNQIILTGDEFIHLSKVLRLQINDEVECFYDESDVLTCKIKEITKKEAKLSIVSQHPCVQNPNVKLTLFQALTKQDKLETVSQKLTEMGAEKIVMFSSKFCIAKENNNKFDRLNKIIVSACKQCGRTNLLKVDGVKAFNEMLIEIEKFDIVVFACELEDECNKLNNLINDKIDLTSKNLNIAYIIGSEGGFSLEEAEQIKQKKNVISISLGKRILRTETASVVVGAILLNKMGEL